MDEINLKWFFWARVGSAWPGEGIRVWIVPDEAKEWTLEEFFGVTDGSEQEPVAIIIYNGRVLLSSGEDVFDIIWSDGFLVDQGNS